ncbi:class I SAM-dependent methyltransferase [Sphingobacterium corticibacter]|uniref:Methyltransferase n=1 Tax=Sphingobacterium corticibacter TaxID=2171749 RepID=A0A2T8HN82_9SPHI|nr:methyltransferase domain-containing protein [Sphingobacterium corticibacter]PVH26904.1 methyltransferase [Sphingobacterium corticibacter]
MVIDRNRFQGVWNIIRFNWHFYVLAIAIFLVSMVIAYWSKPPWNAILYGIASVGLITLSISLLVSYYVYDQSDLYELPFLPEMEGESLLNVHAGFDEISTILIKKYPKISLSNADFFDSKKHTEISIRRARKAYLPHASTIWIDTNNLPFANQSFDRIIIFLAAHEIRKEDERIRFFQELNRVCKATGTIYVTEHLRDVNNFAAYTIGALHFYAHKTWLNSFRQAELKLTNAVNTTPFITTFMLSPNGNSY